MPDDVTEAPQRARALRWSLRSRLAKYPGLYLPIARRKFPDAVLGPDTELLIDGYTRSAVTFATIAFQLAQPSPVRVSHTLHAPGHVLAAVRRGVPTLVTIREPEPAVLSAVVREPYVSVREALAAYVRFYSRIQPLRSNIVVGEFERVTHDLGGVIRDVNRRFGTQFREFRHTEESVSLCYEIIEDRARRPPWEDALGRFQAGIITHQQYVEAAERYSEERARPAGPVPERRVQRPSKERDALKDALRDRLGDVRLASLRSSARFVYERFVSG